MSIYPVRLSKWFPFGDELYEIAKCIIDTSRCYSCGCRIRYKAAVGQHSLLWGYGDVWCSWKCCKSHKIAKLDARREKRIKRNAKTNYYLDVVTI